MIPLPGDLRFGARADLHLQGTPHLLHLRMCTLASSCTPQCHLHPHRHLTLRHTNTPQSSHRCPLIPHHSVDRNERASRLGLVVSRACPLLVVCGLVRLRLLGGSRIHMHRVHKHVPKRRDSTTRAWRSASDSRTSDAGQQAAVAIGRRMPRLACGSSKELWAGAGRKGRAAASQLGTHRYRPGPCQHWARPNPPPVC